MPPDNSRVQRIHYTKSNSVAEGVDVSDVVQVVCETVPVCIGYGQHLTPRIVGISCNNRSGVVGDRNDIALQVLIEIVCGIVMFDSANRSVKAIQVLIDIFRAIAGIGHDLLDDVRSVKDIIMNLVCRLLLNPNVSSLYHTFPALSRKTPHPTQIQKDLRWVRKGNSELLKYFHINNNA